MPESGSGRLASRSGGIGGNKVQLDCHSRTFRDVNRLTSTLEGLQEISISIGAVFDALPSEGLVIAGRDPAQQEMSVLVRGRILEETTIVAERRIGDQHHGRPVERSMFLLNGSLQLRRSRSRSPPAISALAAHLPWGQKRESRCHAKWKEESHSAFVLRARFLAALGMPIGRGVVTQTPKGRAHGHAPRRPRAGTADERLS